MSDRAENELSGDRLPDVVTVAGDGPGLRLLVLGGIHGDEYLPMLAVREWILRFRKDERLRSSLRGTVTLVPVANPPAFAAGTRCGPDGRDLARTFPGRPEGGSSERIAYRLAGLIESADALVDLHTGGTELCVEPLAGYLLHPDLSVRNRQEEMARAFDLPLVWATPPDLEGRTLSVARDVGVPAIYVEYLGAHRERAEIEAGAMSRDSPDHPLVTGCGNVMRHLDILPGGEPDGDDPVVLKDHRPQSGHMQADHPAPVAGFLRPLVELGQRVDEGRPLAAIGEATSEGETVVLAERSGIVIVQRAVPRVGVGDSVAVVAESTQQP